MNKQALLINKETELKIEELISQMTLDEKIGQLNQVGPSPIGDMGISKEELDTMLETGLIGPSTYEKILAGEPWYNDEIDIKKGRIGAFLAVRDLKKINMYQKIAVEESRLGIPLMFGYDVIHGYRTIFPTPLGESCSWDEAVFEETARISAKEAAANGIHWTFAPMVDISRDARWGRIAESPGEDTYLACRFAEARVRGFQGENLSDPDRLLACAKHFVAYGACEAGRDYNQADMSMQTLWETYMPPFEAATKEGVATFMGAFNDINGVPCTTNPYLYNTVLREKWGFNGAVVSDAGAIQECLMHGNVADREDAARQALNAGMEIDMVSRCYMNHIPDLIKSGKVTMETLDEAVRRVLRLKFAAGLFEHPYVDPELGPKMYLCKEHRAASRNAAKRSIVLLKNNGVLPLKKTLNIAIVGPAADDGSNMNGCWGALWKEGEAVSLAQGFKNRGINVKVAACCDYTEKGLDIDALNEAIKDADLVIAAVGEHIEMSGEAHSRAYIGLCGSQNQMLDEIKKANKPLVTILFNGRPLAVPNVQEISDAVVEAWQLGSEAGNAICDVLFGDYNPSGRLTTTFPNDSGECPRYYNHTNTGRPRGAVRHTCKHEDVPLKPLYPFGFGLSYTEYEYSDLSAVVDNGVVTATVKVKNTGKVAGEETVQLYVNDVLASRVRPVRELKGFKKVWLEAGEEKTVTVEVKVCDLGFYDVQMNYVVEPGEFKLWMGHDSECELVTSFEIQ